MCLLVAVTGGAHISPQISRRSPCYSVLVTVVVGRGFGIGRPLGCQAPGRLPSVPSRGQGPAVLALLKSLQKVTDSSNSYLFSAFRMLRAVPRAVCV